MPDVIETELEEYLSLCYNYIGIFSKTFLPEAFFSPFSILHDQINSALDSSHQKIAIAAPRGLGKTTIARALISRSILFRQNEFVMYVSNSETVAELQTENIKRELKTNREIRKLFGNIQINSDDTEIDESFSKRAWVAYGNTMVLPRGANQQVRGLLFKNYRPQLIIVDDLEKKDELENPENRRKLKDWFHSDLEKCIDRYSNKWRIIYIDTLKHHDSLLQELLNSPEWYPLRLDLCDDNYNSLVPDLISTQELQKELTYHRENGMLDVFYMEYRNIPVSKEDASFRSEYFKYYDEKDLDEKNLENIVIVDPAKTVRIQSADSAVVGIGVDYRTNAIYFRDVISGKMYPEEIYNNMFDMAARLKASAIGIEVTGLEEFIKQPILNEMQKRGPRYNFEIIWLKARGGSVDGEKGKIKRIASLVPYYRQGYIYHNKSNCAKLESQLLDFPRSALLDVADASAYIIEMLEIGQRYFSTPNEDPSDISSEYSSLDYDKPMEDWRLV